MRSLVAPLGWRTSASQRPRGRWRRSSQRAVPKGSPHPATLRHGLGDRAQGYTAAVPDEATDNGFPSADEVDVEALFAALREEIRRSGADPGAAREPGRPSRRARRGGASLARLGRPGAPAAAGRSGRRRDAREGRAPEADALVRRAARLRPAIVQRGGAPARRRPRAAGRAASRRSWRGSARRRRARDRRADRRSAPPGAVRARRRRDLHRRARRGAPGPRARRRPRLRPVQVVSRRRAC